MREKIRANNACRTQSQKEIHKIKNRIFFKSCIGNYYSHSVIPLLKVWAHFEQRGIMPYDGALLDQPNKIIEVFDVMTEIKADKIKANESANKAALGAANGRRR